MESPWKEAVKAVGVEKTDSQTVLDRSCSVRFAGAGGHEDNELTKLSGGGKKFEEPAVAKKKRTSSATWRSKMAVLLLKSSTHLTPVHNYLNTAKGSKTKRRFWRKAKQ
jgi:hypothetical protein